MLIINFQILRSFAETRVGQEQRSCNAIIDYLSRALDQPVHQGTELDSNRKGMRVLRVAVSWMFGNAYEEQEEGDIQTSSLHIRLFKESRNVPLARPGTVDFVYFNNTVRLITQTPAGTIAAFFGAPDLSAVISAEEALHAALGALPDDVQKKAAHGATRSLLRYELSSRLFAARSAMHDVSRETLLATMTPGLIMAFDRRSRAEVWIQTTIKQEMYARAPDSEAESGRRVWAEFTADEKVRARWLFQRTFIVDTPNSLFARTIMSEAD